MERPTAGWNSGEGGAPVGAFESLSVPLLFSMLVAMRKGTGQGPAEKARGVAACG